MNLLLLEDNHDAARSIAEGLYILDNRYTFRLAASLQEALDILRTDAFDIALVDTNFPDIREGEAPIVLRRCAPNLPVVAISAVKFEQAAVELAKHGIQDFLQKGSASIQRIHQSLQLAVVRHAREASLRDGAASDPLTGAASRNGIKSQVAKAISHAERSGLCAALLLLDIDNFKAVNDTFGHPVGDAVLQDFAVRLNAATRNGDTVGRLGGDEFVLICEGLSAPEDVQPIAKRVREHLRFDFRVQNQMVAVSATIGAAVFPVDSNTFNGLIEHADRAKYAAKQRRGATNFPMANNLQN